MTLALIIFLLMYGAMLAFSKQRVYFALGAAFLMVLFGIVPASDILKSVDWNVIMMILGTMGIVSLFIESGMPARLADLILTKSPDVCTAIVSLALFAGVISAFVDNVATVLMVAPVGIAVCRKMRINPVPVVISIAVSSNLQGAATLVGDTTSILLGGYAHMSFIDFIWWKGRPSIFWAVELGAFGTVFILRRIFRDQKKPVESCEITKVTDHVPGIMLFAVVISLIIASFFNIPYVNGIKNGLICMSLCIIDVFRSCVKDKCPAPLKLVLKEIDVNTIGMLCGLFVVIERISKAGIIDAIAGWFSSIGEGNIFLLYSVIVFASVILSAFIDNIPYVAAMLPVVEGIALKTGTDPTVLYFGLLSGATLGGNITPFGASANVTGIGILRKEGYEVSNKDFFKIGVPFTLTAVLIGYVLIWLIWG